MKKETMLKEFWKEANAWEKIFIICYILAIIIVNVLATWYIMMTMGIIGGPLAATTGLMINKIASLVIYTLTIICDMALIIACNMRD